MGINDFYRDTLKVPLKHCVQSWGSFDLCTNRVFLSVWADQLRRGRAGEVVRVLNKEPRNNSMGYPERRSHIESITNGADGFGVLCTAANTAADLQRRAIKHFEPSYLLRLGAITKRNGDTFARIEGHIPINEITSSRNASTVAEESGIEGLKTEYRLFKTARSSKLRDAAFEAAKGVCAVCGRDFSHVLGGRGIRALQVHHCKQLSARKAPSVTKVSDLAVVCANCHLLLHLDSGKALTVARLREMLHADRL
jgi:hypothetical protein